MAVGENASRATDGPGGREAQRGGSSPGEHGIKVGRRLSCFNVTDGPGHVLAMGFGARLLGGTLAAGVGGTFYLREQIGHENFARSASYNQ